MAKKKPNIPSNNNVKAKAQANSLNRAISRIAKNSDELVRLTNQILSSLQQQQDNKDNKNKKDNKDQEKDKMQKRKQSWFFMRNLATSVAETIVDVIKSSVNSGFQKWVEIDKRVFTTGRQMGMSAPQIRGMQENVLKNYGEMSNRLGMTFEDIFKFQDNYQKTVGKSVILTNKQVESFAGLSKFMGEEAVNQMVDGMDKFGSSSANAIDYLTMNMARAASQGLNIEQTSTKFAKNLQMASKYTFKEGVNGVSKMTLLSQQLKFNLESIGRAMDNFSNIEDAITNSANIQVLGGAYAANFGNPLQTMGMALLDAEGFTQNIIDTVSKNAVFDKEKGEVTMSPIEKAKLKEFAKNANIDYDELWNMASQKAKISDIEKFISGKNFTDEQKAFIANTAQYDKETQRWSLNILDKGENKPIDIAKLDENTLKEIQSQNDIDKYIQGDVHGIRQILDEYLKGRVNETRTAEEMYKGQQERLKTWFADILDGPLNTLKEALGSASMLMFALGTFGGGMLGSFLTKGLRGIPKQIYNAFGKEKIPVGPSGNAKPQGKASGKVFKGGFGRSMKRLGIKTLGRDGLRVFKGGFGRSMKRLGIKTLGRTGLRTASKAIGKIPYIGALVEAGIGAYDSFNAISKHKAETDAIRKDQNLSKEEKDKAIYESRKNKNKSVGKAVGSTSGALAGIGIGMAIGGPIGAVVGGLAGLAISHFGGKAGEKIGEKLTEKPKQTNIVSKPKRKHVQATVAHTQAAITSGIAMQDNSSMASGYDKTQSAKVDDMDKANIEKAKTLSSIQEDVHKISNQMSTPIKYNDKNNQLDYNDTIAINSRVQDKLFNNSIRTKNEYDSKTYIKETVSRNNMPAINQPKVEKINLNINGTIKLQGGGKTTNYDIREVMESQEFQRLLLAKINEGLSRNGNAVQTRNLDSTQSIVGGYYTPNQSNSI